MTELRDYRLFMTPGSRWRLPLGLYEDNIRYPRDTEFTLYAYDDRTSKLAVQCPSHAYNFECLSDARRYENNALVTGTINYSRVKSHRLQLIEPARGRVYFIRSGNKFYTGNRNTYYDKTGWIGEARVYMHEAPAWKGLVVDAAHIQSLHLFENHDFTLHAFDPMTKTEYQLDLPEWKWRMFRFFSKTVAQRVSRTVIGSLVLMVLKAEREMVVGEVINEQGQMLGWEFAAQLAKQHPKVRAGAAYLFFHSEEDAVMAKLTTQRDIRLFSV